MTRTLMVASALMLLGCETMRATNAHTPKERVTECETLCEDVGMTMSALVIIMSNAGCVCEKTPRPGVVSGASAVSAGAVVAATAAAAQRQQQMLIHR